MVGGKMDDLDNIEETLEENESVDMDKNGDGESKSSNKPDAKKVVAAEVIIDETQLTEGFDFPFYLKCYITDEPNKANILEAVVQGLNTIREKFPDSPSYEKSYKRWVEITFNVSDGLFQDKKKMSDELNKVNNNLNLLVNAKPEVDVMPENNLLEDPNII